MVHFASIKFVVALLALASLAAAVPAATPSGSYPAQQAAQQATPVASEIKGGKAAMDADLPPCNWGYVKSGGKGCAKYMEKKGY